MKNASSLECQLAHNHLTTKTKVLPTCLFLLVNLFFVFGFELDAFRLMICLFPLLYILICFKNYLHLVVGYQLLCEYETNHWNQFPLLSFNVNFRSDFSTCRHICNPTLLYFYGGIQFMCQHTCKWRS